MKQKRIAVISYHTCPLASQEGKETGGMNIYVLDLAKKLAQKGYHVDIFTRSQDVDNPEIVEVEENLRVIHLIAGPQKMLSKKSLFPFIEDFVFEYKKFVQKEKMTYAVLHCHYYLSGLIGLEIKQQVHKVPLVMSFHTLALMKNLVARNQDEQEETERIDAEFLLSKKADIVITPSETELLYMQYLYDCPQKRLVAIPPGVNRSHFHPIDKTFAKQTIDAKQNEKIVLFVGRIEPVKGIDTLIYAIKILVSRCPKLHVRLLIVGGDVSQKKSLWKKELQRLEALRRILHIPDIVTFVGQRLQEELPFYYNSAEVVVMPSHYESFGMSALEAMACGIPVITSNVSGVANIIDEKHASLITSVNNPLLLASQIEDLLTDEKLHKKVSKTVLEDTADFTWNSTADQILKVYNSFSI